MSLRSRASLECVLEKIIYHEKKHFDVITGPVMHPGLPEVERSVKKQKIPELYYIIIED